MMTLYRSFTRLDNADRWLVVQAASVMALVWAGLRLLRFSTLRRILYSCAGSQIMRPARRPDARAINRVRWAIRAVAARFPAATCLVQALAGQLMLERRGLPCELRIGVRAGCAGGVPIEAHAWVECNGGVAIGAIEDLSAFHLLTAPASHASRDSLFNGD